MTIALAIMIAVVAWGLYVTKHATEYPEWFDDDNWPYGV